MSFLNLPPAVRILRSVHSWLGVIILPWFIMIGMTGIYLNHASAINAWLPNDSYDENLFDSWPNPQPVDEAAALAVAQLVLPQPRYRLSKTRRYHRRPVWKFSGRDGQVIVAQETGHYWVKTRFERLTFDPTGKLLNKKVYWGSIFKTLHVRGWINSSLKSWLADLTAGAMVVFGLTGIILFVDPRLRRRRNRRARKLVTKTAV